LFGLGEASLIQQRLGESGVPGAERKVRQQDSVCRLGGREITKLDFEFGEALARDKVVAVVADTLFPGFSSFAWSHRRGGKRDPLAMNGGKGRPLRNRENRATKPMLVPGCDRQSRRSGFASQRAGDPFSQAAVGVWAHVDVLPKIGIRRLDEALGINQGRLFGTGNFADDSVDSGIGAEAQSIQIASLTIGAIVEGPLRRSIGRGERRAIHQIHRDCGNENARAGATTSLDYLMKVVSKVVVDTGEARVAVRYLVVDEEFESAPLPEAVANVWRRR
jgi:hypothetical protein